MIIGQLTQVTNHENGTWKYGVVTNVFDDRTLVENQYGGLTMVVHIPDEEDCEDYNRGVVALCKQGAPVMAKKTLFGRYKFPKRKAMY